MAVAAATGEAPGAGGVPGAGEAALAARGTTSSRSVRASLVPRSAVTTSGAPVVPAAARAARADPCGGGSRGASARGGAKGGPKAPSAAAQRRIQGKPARPRELDAKIEQRNRDRYADKPEIRTPRTNPGAEQEGERLQKILARAAWVRAGPARS